MLPIWRIFGSLISSIRFWQLISTEGVTYTLHRRLIYSCGWSRQFLAWEIDSHDEPTICTSYGLLGSHREVWSSYVPFVPHNFVQVLFRWMYCYSVWVFQGPPKCLTRPVPTLQQKKKKLSHNCFVIIAAWHLTGPRDARSTQVHFNGFILG